MFKNIQNNKIKSFLTVWLIITALITLIAATAILGFYDSKVINIKAEEIQANPQLSSAVQQWQSQGATDKQIKQRIDKIAFEQAGAGQAIKVMKKSSFRAAAIAIISFLLFYFLFSNKKVSKQRGSPSTLFNNRGLSFAFALIALMLVDQLYIARKFVMKEPVNFTLQKPDAIAKLQTATPPFRVAVLDKGAYNLWVTSLFQLHGIECTDVPADSRPTPLRKMFFYSNAISPVKRWEYCNVKYILGPRRGIEMFLSQMGVRDQFSSFYSYNLNNQQHAIYQFNNTLPRVYTVGEWIIITNANEAIEFMNNPVTDPHNIAIVSDNKISKMLNDSFTGTVKIENYNPVKIDSVVELSATGLVAMATESDGNWKIFVDDAPAKIVNCNLLHFGTIVPPGKHSVTFLYDKKPATISKITAAAYIFLPVLVLLTLFITFISKSNKS